MYKFLTAFFLGCLSILAADSIVLSKEILYFRPQADAMEYAIIQKWSKDGFDDLRVKNTKFAPSLGNRLRISYTLPKLWSVSAGYTNIGFNCLSKNKHSDNDIANYLALDPTRSHGLATYVSSSWLIDHQNIDLKIGRTFPMSRYVSIGSSLSAKCHYLHHISDTKYLNLWRGSDKENLDSCRALNTSRFLGAGVEVGFSGNFHITESFRIIYSVNSGMVKGKFKNKGLQYKNEVNHLRFTNNRYSIMPIVSHSIGIGYATYKGLVDLDFSVSYEANLFSNHLKQFNLYGLKSSNILMDGFVLKAQIGF